MKSDNRTVVNNVSVYQITLELTGTQQGKITVGVNSRISREHLTDADINNLSALSRRIEAACFNIPHVQDALRNPTESSLDTVTTSIRTFIDQQKKCDPYVNEVLIRLESLVA